MQEEKYPKSQWKKTCISHIPPFEAQNSNISPTVAQYLPGDVYQFSPALQCLKFKLQILEIIISKASLPGKKPSSFRSEIIWPVFSGFVYHQITNFVHPCCMSLQGRSSEWWSLREEVLRAVGACGGRFSEWGEVHFSDLFAALGRFWVCISIKGLLIEIIVLSVYK